MTFPEQTLRSPQGDFRSSFDEPATLGGSCCPCGQASSPGGFPPEAHSRPTVCGDRCQGQAPRRGGALGVRAEPLLAPGTF